MKFLLSLSSDTVNVQNADCLDMDRDVGGAKMWSLIMTERKVHVSEGKG